MLRDLLESRMLARQQSVSRSSFSASIAIIRCIFTPGRGSVSRRTRASQGYCRLQPHAPFFPPSLVRCDDASGVQADLTLRKV